MQFEEKEEMPYKKKKESSVSKSKAKSKHKHQYDKTVIIGYRYKEFPDRYFADVCECCTVCGKLRKDLLWWAGDKFDHSLEAAKLKYPDVEVFVVPYNTVFSAKNIKDLKK